MALLIKTSPAEVLLAKFSRTLSTLQGYVSEAEGDIAVGTRYQPEAVHRRLLAVQQALQSDLAQLSIDITVTEQ